VVIGPPGSGKTTYCNGMQQFLRATGRKISVVNLDPANDFLPYECAINMADLITLEEVMEEFKLGPNGGMMYCMEYLEKNIDWLEEKLKSLKDEYFLFDFPGQVELFTHHGSVKNIIERLQKLDYRLVTVHLVDAHYCTDPSKYISALLLSLKTMLQIELPHVNVLSKVDLMESYGKLAFNLDFYTEDKKSVMDLVKVIDKANGYVFGGLTEGNESIMLTAMSDVNSFHDVMDVQERWLDHREIWDEWEAKQKQQVDQYKQG
ncbi:24715_t:CDS:2, partial [Racocetra persica]